MYARYICQGYHQKMEDGHLMDYVEVDVLADTEEDALVKAAARVAKPHWRVKLVVEYDPVIEGKVAAYNGRGAHNAVGS